MDSQGTPPPVAERGLRAVGAQNSRCIRADRETHALSLACCPRPIAGPPRPGPSLLFSPGNRRGCEALSPLGFRPLAAGGRSGPRKNHLPVLISPCPLIALEKAK